MTEMPPDGGMRSTPSTHRRAVLTRGVAWSAFGETAQLAVSFAGMLVLARLMPPGEYGKAGAAAGILFLLSAFNAAGMLVHTIQLPDGEEPDWSQHWHAAMVLQGAQFLLVNAVAAACWLLPTYRAIAPLLHVGSIGCLLALPHLLGYHMLLREFDFARSRLGLVACNVLNTATAVSMAFAGYGAMAIVAGSQFAALLPFSLYLLVVRRWRPATGWLRWPDWRAHAAAMRFWGQALTSGLLYSARGALEAAVLPGALGFASLGLLGRAQALHANTSGRVGNVLRDAVYPVLPRSARDPQAFGRHATLFVLVALLSAFGGAAFLGIEGAQLSRVLYGMKWVEADPLIWPAALVGAGYAVIQTAGFVLRAVGRVRALVAINVAESLLTAPLVLLTLAGLTLHQYAWLLAAAEFTAALVALALASRHLARGWIGSTFLPPFVSVALAGSATVLARQALVGRSSGVVLALTVPLFLAVAVILLRLMYPHVLVAVCSRIRPLHWLLRLLRLNASPSSAASSAAGSAASSAASSAAANTGAVSAGDDAP